MLKGVIPGGIPKGAKVTGTSSPRIGQAGPPKQVLVKAVQNKAKQFGVNLSKLNAGPSKPRTDMPRVKAAPEGSTIAKLQTKIASSGQEAPKKTSGTGVTGEVTKPTTDTTGTQRGPKPGTSGTGEPTKNKSGTNAAPKKVGTVDPTKQPDGSGAPKKGKGKGKGGPDGQPKKPLSADILEKKKLANEKKKAKANTIKKAENAQIKAQQNSTPKLGILTVAKVVQSPEKAIAEIQAQSSLVAAIQKPNSPTKKQTQPSRANINKRKQNSIQKQITALTSSTKPLTESNSKKLNALTKKRNAAAVTDEAKKKANNNEGFSMEKLNAAAALPEKPTEGVPEKPTNAVPPKPTEGEAQKQLKDKKIKHIEEKQKKKTNKQKRIQKFHAKRKKEQEKIKENQEAELAKLQSQPTNEKKGFFARIFGRPKSKAISLAKTRISRARNSIANSSAELAYRREKVESITTKYNAQKQKVEAGEPQKVEGNAVPKAEGNGNAVPKAEGNAPVPKPKTPAQIARKERQREKRTAKRAAVAAETANTVPKPTTNTVPKPISNTVEKVPEEVKPKNPMQEIANRGEAMVKRQNNLAAKKQTQIAINRTALNVQRATGAPTPRKNTLSAIDFSKPTVQNNIKILEEQKSKLATNNIKGTEINKQISNIQTKKTYNNQSAMMFG